MGVVFYFSPLKWRVAVLLSASYVFYFSFNPKYIFFIIATTLVSYVATRVIHEKSRLKNFALFVALTLEGTLLFITKYWNSIADTTGAFSVLNILVPLGISFYTFQTIGYLFDVYRGYIKPEKNLTRFALFISFFPHLLAGPIEPAQKFFPQLDLIQINRKNIKFGLFLICLGLFKKMVIADRIGPIVEIVFGSPSDYGGSAIAFSLLLARYQIYCDFSGYTDIALGSAQIFGLILTQNFNRPFAATSITEYWRRWHISLANWIRNYIFFPLVATKVARIGVQGLILLTFLILGVWHGGSINYLIYGLWHGLFVILDASTRSRRDTWLQKCCIKTESIFFKYLCTLFTFSLIVVPSTLFFRSLGIKETEQLLSSLVTHWSISDLKFIYDSPFFIYCLQIAIPAIFILEIFQWKQERVPLLNKMFENSNRIFWFILFTMLFSIIVLGYRSKSAEFIYMRF